MERPRSRTVYLESLSPSLIDADAEEQLADIEAKVSNRQLLDRLFEKIYPRARAILEQHYVEGKEYWRIDAELDLRKGRAEQIRNAAIGALKNRAKALGQP